MAGRPRAGLSLKNVTTFMPSARSAQRYAGIVVMRPPISGSGTTWRTGMTAPPVENSACARSSVHQETSLCVACHATHFPLRAQLYATRNGYPVVERQELQFLTERFYNNPRPFYGFEDSAVWARVISAPA